MLVLNDGKTELVVFRPKSANSTLVPQTLTAGEATIHCSKSARDLCSLFDQHMAMDQQISSACQAVHFHVRAIGRVGSFIDHAATKQLVHALVISRLGCYNSPPC